MQLYYWPTSPYVRKVMVVALETGQADDFEILNTSPSQAGHDLQDRNPLGKIPALVLDDGTVLFDSPVICEYLDNRRDGGKLIPKPGPARWRALRQQAEADGILDAAVLRRMEQRRREEIQSKAWIAHQSTAVHRALAHLDTEVETLAGELTIGQIAIGCALGYLDFRLPDDDWRAFAPNLSDWYAGFAERPSMRATAPAEPA